MQCDLCGTPFKNGSETSVDSKCEGLAVVELQCLYHPCSERSAVASHHLFLDTVHSTSSYIYDPKWHGVKVFEGLFPPMLSTLPVKTLFQVLQR